MDNIKYYTLLEAKDLIKTGIQTLRRYIKAGRIKAYKLGRQYLIAENDLKEFIETQKKIKT